LKLKFNEKFDELYAFKSQVMSDSQVWLEECKEEEEEQDDKSGNYRRNAGEDPALDLPQSKQSQHKHKDKVSMSCSHCIVYCIMLCYEECVKCPWGRCSRVPSRDIEEDLHRWGPNMSFWRKLVNMISKLNATHL